MFDVMVMATGTGDWNCTKWVVGPEEGTVDHADHEDPSGVTETFEITAPAAPATYNLVIELYSNNGCGGPNPWDTETEDDAIVVGEPVIIIKTLVSGPLTTSFEDDPVDACPGCTKGTNDAGPIGINLTESTHYVVQMEFVDDFDGHVFADTFGADWDLDPAAEEDWGTGPGAFTFPLDGNCGGGGDDCTGAVGNCDDGTCDGIAFSENEGSCLVMATQPPSGDGIGFDKEPEFIDVLVDLAAEEVCTLLVFVQTVKNPGANEFFEPTGCRLITKGTDIQDTFALNEGLKQFDDATNFRVRGPFDSLQLTCNPLPDD